MIFFCLENMFGVVEVWELNNDVIIVVVNRLNIMNENIRFCYMCFML